MGNNYIEFTMPYPRRFKRVYQLHIRLKGIKPSVWRRIQVPENYTFYDLHVAIQDAMGWEDCHLFEFTKGKIKFRPAYRIISIFDESEMIDSDIKWEFATEVSMKKLLKKEQDSILYTYDFGDDWQHLITLEKILPWQNSMKYSPACVDGELACPPEDCGSIPGYYDCIAAVKNQDNEELLRWLGDWQPENFDPKQVKFERPWERAKKALES